MIQLSKIVIGCLIGVQAILSSYNTVDNLYTIDCFIETLSRII